MYKVYCDDELIYLPGDSELIILNTKLELGDNKSGSFEFRRRIKKITVFDDKYTVEFKSGVSVDIEG